MATWSTITLPDGSPFIVRKGTIGGVNGDWEPVTVVDSNGNEVSDGLGNLRAVQGQTVDGGNTVFWTNTSATFTGTASHTRSLGIVRLLVVLASNVTSGLGGTFTFQFGEDGVTWPISEARPIGDFATVRDFDLINAGEYFRIIFTPSRALSGAEFVAITTTQRRQNDGQFVRLADQPIERQNAALDATFAYIKGFGADGKSVNVQITSAGALAVGEVDPQSLEQPRTSLTRFGIAAEPVRLVGDTFTRGLDTVLWMSTLTNGGTLTQSTGYQVLDTVTTANGSAAMQSVQTFYYQSSLSHSWTGGLTLPDAPGTANNRRTWGPHSVNDGYFFDLTGTTLSVGSRKAGVDTLVPAASWSRTNLAPLAYPYVLDANRHLYEIEYIGSECLFFIDGVCVHEMIPNIPLPRTGVMDFPLRYTNVNSGGSTTSVKLQLTGTALHRFGSEDTRPRFINLTTAATTTVKPGPGTLHHVIVNTAQLGSTLTMYDSLTATGLKIGTIDCSNSAKVLDYDLDFSIGLTLVVAGSVPPDLTVLYD